MTGDASAALAAAIVFLFGSLFGSFLNVLVHRLPRRESVVSPRSRCPRCGRAIPWHENLPIVSWLALRGRCAGCGGPISPRYPLVEALAGALLVLVWARFGPTPAFVAYGAFALVQLALFFTDLEHFLLPDALTKPGIVAGLLFAPFNPRLEPLVAGWPAWTAAPLGAGLGYLLLWGLAAAYRRLRGDEGMGGGDFKLAAMIGAFSGPVGLVQVLLLASLGGTALGLGLIALRRGTLRSTLPFGCFLAPAAVIAVLFDLGVAWAGWQDFVARRVWGIEPP